MTVTSIHAGGRLYSVTGSGYAPVGEILADQEKVQLKEHPELELTLRIGMLANESSLYLEDGD
jgi:cation-transporting ATPase F